jgi:hypothetical protein
VAFTSVLFKVMLWQFAGRFILMLLKWYANRTWLHSNCCSMPSEHVILCHGWRYKSEELLLPTTTFVQSHVFYLFSPTLCCYCDLATLNLKNSSKMIL